MSLTNLKPKKRMRWASGIYRLIISFLDFAPNASHDGKRVLRQKGIRPDLDALKGQVLDTILLQQKHRGLTKYKIAWQTHQRNLLPHLDILLIYDKIIQKSPTSFNYLLKICPQRLTEFPEGKQVPQIHITPYNFRRLNVAILQYGQKEDPEPLTNFVFEDSEKYVILSQIKKDPYAYLQDIMKQDPYNFDIDYYSRKYDLAKHIPAWGSVRSKLKDIQAASRAYSQQLKPGIEYINRQLIQQRLTPQQLKVFDSHQCFQKIVDHINQIYTHGSHRPHKTLNLFLYGPKGIGKTSFLNQGPNCLARYVPTYDIKLQNKYLNRYFNNVYGFISWNEFKYTDFSPTWILQLLQGANVQIPIRYSSNIKRDNPLVIATSNMSLQQHIQRRFAGQPRLIQMAKSNLIGERISEVYIPVEMFFMQKLIVPKK